MHFFLNDLDHWGLSVVLLQVWICLLQQLFTLIFLDNYQVMCTLSTGGSYMFLFWCVWLTRVSRAVCVPDQVCETGLHTLGNFIGRNILGSSPKMARRLEPPGGSIYMYYGVSYHMFAFLFERTFLVIHCKTHLWSLLLTLIGSWTAPSLQPRYIISLRYISYFIFFFCAFHQLQFLEPATNTNFWLVFL